jgi:hypothetical protein
MCAAICMITQWQVIPRNITWFHWSFESSFEIMSVASKDHNISSPLSSHIIYWFDLLMSIMLLYCVLYNMPAMVCGICRIVLIAGSISHKASLVYRAILDADAKGIALSLNVNLVNKTQGFVLISEKFNCQICWKSENVFLWIASCRYTNIIDRYNRHMMTEAHRWTCYECATIYFKWCILI